MPTLKRYLWTNHNAPSQPNQTIEPPTKRRFWTRPPGSPPPPKLVAPMQLNSTFFVLGCSSSIDTNIVHTTMMPTAPHSPKNEKAPPIPSTRRSKREHKSTLVYIDGQAVLKANNYSVVGGHYVHGTEATTERPKKRQRAGTNQLGSLTAGIPSVAVTTAKDKESSSSKADQVAAVTRKSRVASLQEIERRNHNNAVKHFVDQTQGYKWKFLAKHLELLHHFCEPKVLNGIPAMADHWRQQSTQENDDYKPLSTFTKAPKAIQATLRDYQLQGITFMANMHNQNLSMILGDEMGLVSQQFPVIPFHSIQYDSIQFDSIHCSTLPPSTLCSHLHVACVLFVFFHLCGHGSIGQNTADHFLPLLVERNPQHSRTQFGHLPPQCLEQLVRRIGQVGALPAIFPHARHPQ